jgi:hypothetical protein
MNMLHPLLVHPNMSEYYEPVKATPPPILVIPGIIFATNYQEKVLKYIGKNTYLHSNLSRPKSL